MFDAKVIKNIRIDNNMSQEEMAKLLKVSRGSYSMWEGNLEVMPIKRLMLFCEAFDYSLDYIFGFTSNKKLAKSFDSTKHGVRLKQFRKQENLTQLKLAQVLNSSRSLIANCETNLSILTTDFLYTICSKYGVSADYLLGRTELTFYWDKEKESERLENVDSKEKKN